MNEFRHTVVKSLMILVLSAALPVPLIAQMMSVSPSPTAASYIAAPGEFAPIGQAVVTLLKSKSATEFVTNFAVRPEDWKSLITTNTSKDDADRYKNFESGAGYNVKKLKAEAEAVLKRASSLHLNFSEGELAFKAEDPSKIGRIYLSEKPSLEQSLPYLEKLEISLSHNVISNRTEAGIFKITLRGLEKFPSGWRVTEGIQWTSFPTNLVDAKTLREMAILNKISTRKPITSEDDPSLMKLSESLLRFVRDQDANAFKKELLCNSDLIWAQLQKLGRTGPSRAELDEEIAKQSEEQTAIAGKMADFMKAIGLDLKTADIQIKDARINHCQSQGPAGTADTLIGTQFKMTLAVKTDGKAKTGESLSGTYILAVKQIVKFGEEWKVAQDVQWETLPKGVVDPDTAAKIEFENYVAEHGELPGGTMAPDFAFTALSDTKAMKLSDFRGKVVVLDFWATWCGPCQKPMADLQKMREKNPDWQDKVTIIPVSIDDTMDIVQKHVNQRGWTNTFNVWAGEGGWRSGAAKTFRVTRVPTSYVINKKGKIVGAGFSGLDSIVRTVNACLTD